MNDPNGPDGSSDLHRRLLIIRHDPQVIALAQTWTGDPDLARDVLEAACYVVATVDHPDRIGSLRTYFLRALKNEAMCLRALHRPGPLGEDPQTAWDAARHDPVVCVPPPSRPIEQDVKVLLRAVPGRDGLI